MKRLWVTLTNDVRLQWRNGFYIVSGIVIVFFLLISTQTGRWDLRWLIGAFVVGNLVVTSFYFVAGLLLLEKNEGTLLAQVVSPLRGTEYLGGKFGSLFLIACIESLMIVVVFVGVKFNPILFLAGLLLAFGLFLFSGLVMVTHYSSINAFLLPSVLVIGFLTLPLDAYLGHWQHWLFYLHPLQPLLILINAAFQPEAPGMLVYGILAGMAWVFAAGWWANRRLQSYMQVG
ncbi:MAG: ABC transporter permease [Chloroflexi bacterium HGW-Chloroflexi-10]|nr:MAG: ABC transporter permease [Chloroflexi bacterium HGW-Chloroflexi-10]